MIQETSMKTAPPQPYGSTRAEPMEFHGVRVDHPSILSSVQNGIKMGWNNERIMTVVGVPSEVVDREREKIRKQRQEK